LKDADNKFHKITARHVARLLTLLEGLGASPSMISSVKSEMWDLHNDLIESKESKESNGGDDSNGLGKSQG